MEKIIARLFSKETYSRERQIQKSSSLNPPIITGSDAIGIIGFSLYLSWVISVLLNPLLIRSEIDKDLASSVVFCFFLGGIIASCFTWIISGKLTSVPSVVAVIIFVIISAPIPVLVVINGFIEIPVLYFAWGIAGFSAVYLLSLWAIFLSKLTHKKAVLYPALSMFIQTVILFFIFFVFRSDALVVAMILIPLASTILFVYWAFKLNKLEDILLTYDSTRPQDGKSLLRSSVAMIANGILLGFPLYCLSISSSATFLLCALTAMIVATLYKIYDSTHYQRYEVNIIIKIIAPTAAIGFLSFPYFGIEWKIACCVFMFLVATINESICWSAVSEYMRVYRLVPFANIAFGRAGDILGLACGYACGKLLLGSTLMSESENTYILDLLVIALVVVQTFIFRDSYSPFAENKGTDLNHSETNCYSNPGVSHIGRWRIKCSEFARNYQLTSRQEEVLVLLAKGYSTSYIRDVLFVSDHTIKAHIYNIYRKVDVHSRQELIKLIEDYE
ncbi:MAG: helix-turn-helix transcriptional regulator [Clostridia bacterium]|nr:helix-turn-helix transcriptional regulator [Clostridia bacterium]